MNRNRFTYKRATEPWEFEQIHHLNYQTFVEEIPQHSPNSKGWLVDKFHEENTYFICLDGSRVAGMVAARGKRPFSLDAKIENLDDFLPVGELVCEVRLLAVEPEFRHTNLFAGLFQFAAKECIRQGYTLGVVSGTLRQTRLYSRMGFVSFAEPVGTAEARYQPMYLTLHSALKVFERLGASKPEIGRQVSFLPGPVEVKNDVREAFYAQAISHRSDHFLGMVSDAKNLLCKLSGATSVELLVGSGTLGNDAVAAQLKLLGGQGLLLSNGEFGERLIDHAGRYGLSFDIIRALWGSPYDLEKIERFLARQRSISWIWSTHCETSTGLLNDLEQLKRICLKYGIRLCMDCTSSLGTVPLDMRGVYLATSVSGKGLAAFPGIAMVFYNHEVAVDRRLPRYLDLGYYREHQGVPFTHSSNLVKAVHKALQIMDWNAHFLEIKRLNTLLRSRLEDTGFRILTREEFSSPAVISIAIPPFVSSMNFGEELEKQGYLLSYKSSYLVERNIVQICLMGDISEKQCCDLLELFFQLSTFWGT